MTPERLKKAQDILRRRTAKNGVYPSFDEAAQRITDSKQLLFYGGYDPTGPQLHIGHSVGLLLMKALARDLGHSIIVLYGDFTARIGDPTEKESARKALNEEEINEHMSTWDQQIAVLFGDVPYTIKHNSEWLSGMSFVDVIKLSTRVTVQQMLARDMFQERINKERPIYLNEFLYPLAQGYDSVAMRVDGEVGAVEQVFNMLVGREFSKEILGKDKLILATPLIVDSKTGKKMSKSGGEVIAINDPPQEIRRKILDISDGVTKTTFELCTEKEQNWINEQCDEDGKPRHPREFKEALAAELIRMYHGDEAVNQATEAMVVEGKGSLLKTLYTAGIIPSMSSGKNLVKEGAILVNGRRVETWDVPEVSGDVIQVGKGRFVRVK